MPCDMCVCLRACALCSMHVQLRIVDKHNLKHVLVQTDFVSLTKVFVGLSIPTHQAPQPSLMQSCVNHEKKATGRV